MRVGAPGSFGAQLKALREAAGFTQEELATIAGLSVHAVSALERGERRRPHVETVRALSAALDLTGANRDAFLGSARASAHATAADELVGASLPSPLTPLLGRDTEMETLRQWLGDPVSRLITLIGPGGVGKTRLVLELARTIAKERATRVVFVSLAAIRDVVFVAPTIAEALGLSDVTALDLPKRARAACADRPTLLVLDNFEHLLDAVTLVADLLTSVPSLRLLVTSRAPLRVRGEREYVVGPLELAPPSQMSLADLARVPAVRLLVERMRDVQPDFRLTPANGPTMTVICRCLDGLPLALELAAPWIKALTLDDLRRRLEHDSLLGTIGARDLPERQQTMNATVAWSYRLLDPEEQCAFRRFGALPGFFPIDAAEAVLAGREGVSDAGAALRVVGGLIDKSLLVRSDSPVVATCPLYRMLDTVRAYAALELTAAGERDDALEGLARYCAGEVSLAVEGLVGPAQVEWLDRVREDLESYRVVLTWLVERGRLTEASHIAWGLLWFWVIRGHAIEGLRWYEEILSRPPLPPGVESRVLNGAAVMRYMQGDFDRARTNVSRALILAEGSGDTDAAVHAEWILGFVEHAVGNLDAARDCLARSVKGFRAQAIRWATGQSLTGLAWVALATGDPGQAERLLDEATSVLRDAGPWFLSLVAYLRAILAVRRGDADEAIALIRDSLTRIRELKDHSLAFVGALVVLAAAAALKGDDTWVARILGAQDAVTDGTGVIVVDSSSRHLREQVERDSQARLGPERWALAYAAGRKASIDALIKDIDDRQPRG